MTELTTALISKTHNKGVPVKDTTSKPEYAENHENMPPYWSADHTSSTYFNIQVPFQEEYRVESRYALLARRTSRDSADSIVSSNGLDFRGIVVQFLAESKYFSLFQTARTALGPTQSPNECISTAFSWRVSGWGVKPTTYLHPLYWLRMCGGISPLSYTLNIRNRYTLQLLHSLLVPHTHIS